MTKRARRTKPAPAPKRTRTLSARELRFVEGYLIDLNATQAAIRAGYSARTAGQIGYHLLKRVQIAKVIKARMDARADRTGITAERVLGELEELAFSDITHYDMNPDTGHVELVAGAPAKAMRAVASIKHRKIPYGDGDHIHEVELRLWNKPDALKIAGRHVDVHGFFERVELTGKHGAPLAADTVAAMSDEDLKARAAALLAKL